MKKEYSRRDFIKTSSVAGLACCGLFLTNQTLALERIESFIKEGSLIDPSKLNYCGYVCPEDCKFLNATLDDDLELKKEAYKLWDLKNRYDVDFDPDIVFCYGCKNVEKPAGIYLKKCSVRNCAKDKNLDCCIECDLLVNCDKELWTRFPKFKEQIINMQKEYLIQQG